MELNTIVSEVGTLVDIRKNVSKVFCDSCNFKKGADFSVKAW